MTLNYQTHFQETVKSYCYNVPTIVPIRWVLNCGREWVGSLLVENHVVRRPGA